jgi:hypothetical protein
MELLEAVLTKINPTYAGVIVGLVIVAVISSLRE